MYQTKSSVENTEIKSKLDDSDISLVQIAIQEVEEWILEDRSKEEYEQKTTEFNSKINPVMMKIYSEGNMPGSTPDEVPTGSVPPEEPTIDEVD